MGIFTKAAKLSAKAALGTSGNSLTAGAGAQTGAAMIGHYGYYQTDHLRNKAMSVPAISRSRDLFASVIGDLNLRQYSEVFNPDTGNQDKKYMPPAAWLGNIDPALTNNAILSWTLDDMLFSQRSFWYVTSRYSSGPLSGYPASFTRLPIGTVQTLDQVGPIYYGPSNAIYFFGAELDPNNVIQFISGVEGICYQAPTVIETALKLEAARLRNASSAIPAGVLKISQGADPMSPDELSDMATAFDIARMNNQTAALSEHVSYTETQGTPDKMLLIDASNYQALEASRLTNAPPFLLGVSTGAYSYQSSPQARADLYIFGAKTYATTIEQTLSKNNVLPPGTFVEFDDDEYMASLKEMAKTPAPKQNTQEKLANA